jgi:carbon-monoxide dehydrogenase medium subunit
MIAAPFDYVAPESLDDALAALSGGGEDAKLVAGGHSLLPLMKLRLAAPSLLVDLGRIPGLHGIQRENGSWRIGALTRHADLQDTPELGLASLAASQIADQQVRNRGTIGGSLCQADPSEDLSAVCTTLGATCVIRGLGGERVVSMAEFYRGPYETAVGPAELLTEIRIPIRAGGSSAFEKVGRRAGDWAIVSCGVAVWLDDGVISDARVGLAAVGPNTTGIPAVSRALRGRSPSEDLYAEAGAIAAEHCAPVSDQRGTADYKRHLAAELTRRALRRAVARARSDAGEG